MYFDVVSLLYVISICVFATSVACGVRGHALGIILLGCFLIYYPISFLIGGESKVHEGNALYDYYAFKEHFWVVQISVLIFLAKFLFDNLKKFGFFSQDNQE